MKQFIDEKAFSSTSGHVRDLVRQRQRAKAGDRLRELIAEGLASGSADEVTPDTFAELCRELRRSSCRRG